MVVCFQLDQFSLQTFEQSSKLYENPRKRAVAKILQANRAKANFASTRKFEGTIQYPFYYFLFPVKCYVVQFGLFTIFPSEGFSGASQLSVAGYSQLPFPAAFQTHLRSGTGGRRD